MLVLMLYQVGFVKEISFKVFVCISRLEENEFRLIFYIRIEVFLRYFLFIDSFLLMKKIEYELLKANKI